MNPVPNSWPFFNHFIDQFANQRSIFFDFKFYISIGEAIKL